MNTQTTRRSYRIVLSFIVVLNALNSGLIWAAQPTRRGQANAGSPAPVVTPASPQNGPYCITNGMVLVTTNGAVFPWRDPVTALRQNPLVTFYTNRQGAVLPDYHYYSTNRVRPAAPPVIQIEGYEATARNARHTVRFTSNLKDEDAVTITLPDHQVLQGRVCALSISDAAGHRVWLGQVQDTEGELLGDPAHQVIYPDAFKGIHADVVYTYGLNDLEQDVILREKPALPQSIDPETARLEVWTEFAQVPPARHQIRSVMLRTKAITQHSHQPVVAEDESLDFGSMRLVTSQAFGLDTGAGPAMLNSSDKVPAVKQWVRDQDSGYAYLVESVDYLSLQSALDRLPAKQAQAGPLTSITNLAYLNHPAPSSISHSEQIPRRSVTPWSVQLAAQSVNSRPGVVLDYRLVNTSLLDINFGTTTRTGSAAVGRYSDDIWNLCATPSATSGTFSHLMWSDGSDSGISLTLDNAPGYWGNSTGDSMMDSYAYPWNGGNLTVTLTGIPPGFYDFYIYGAWGGVGQLNGNYVLSGEGTAQTILSANWASLNWTQGDQYALYAGVEVDSGQSVVITAYPGDNVALINGLQMIAAGSANTPPTISSIVNQTTAMNTAVGPISFTIGDNETPSSQLTVTATSSNPTLLPNGNITLGGSDSARTIALTPATDQTGTSTVTVTVSDASAQSSTSFTLTVSSNQDYVEIPKSIMTADASSVGWDWLPAYAINGSTSNPGWHNAEGRTPGTDWLRLDLGSSYSVARVQYFPREHADNGTFLDYEIYVTDVYSSNLADWGDPVASGSWTWPYGAMFKTVDFASTSGRYVIFHCLRGVNDDHYYASCDEVWVYTLGETPPQVATPTISPNGGSYSGSVTVSLSTSTSGATIRYTTDSSEPTSSSTVYSGAFLLSQTTTIKAKAFKSGMTDSATAAATFTITVSDSDNDGLLDSWERDYFGDLTHPGNEDYDGDGWTNLQEYQNNSNPTIQRLAVNIGYPNAGSVFP